MTKWSAQSNRLVHTYRNTGNLAVLGLLRAAAAGSVHLCERENTRIKQDKLDREMWTKRQRQLGHQCYGIPRHLPSGGGGRRRARGGQRAAEGRRRAARRRRGGRAEAPPPAVRRGAGTGSWCRAAATGPCPAARGRASGEMQWGAVATSLVRWYSRRRRWRHERPAASGSVVV